MNPLLRIMQIIHVECVLLDVLSLNGGLCRLETTESCNLYVIRSRFMEIGSETDQRVNKRNTS